MHMFGQLEKCRRFRDKVWTGYTDIIDLEGQTFNLARNFSDFPTSTPVTWCSFYHGWCRKTLPLTQVGWQDWVSNCDVDVSTVDLSQIDAECLGKPLGYCFSWFDPERGFSFWNKVLSLVALALNAEAQSWHTLVIARLVQNAVCRCFPERFT